MLAVNRPTLKRMGGSEVRDGRNRPSGGVSVVLVGEGLARSTWRISISSSSVIASRKSRDSPARKSRTPITRRRTPPGSM